MTPIISRMMKSMEWVIPDILARSSRPGYRSDIDAGPVGRMIVDRWIEQAKKMGIQSIICLLDDESNLEMYSNLPGRNLLAYYRRRGFSVAHIPVKDYQTPPLSREDLDNVWREFLKLPKPVMIHCSAGIDRTGVAVEYIKSRLGGSDEGQQSRTD